MHEFGIIDGVVKTVQASAEHAGACSVLAVRLKVGEMTEAQDESLYFAYEVLTEGTLLEGSTLEIEHVGICSQCAECGHEFSHSRYDLSCPQCGSVLTTLIRGKELEIHSIDVDIPEDHKDFAKDAKKPRGSKA